MPGAVVSRSKLACLSSPCTHADLKAHLNLDPTSPRSVEAFLRHGLEPEELRLHTLQQYQALLHELDLAELAQKYQEQIRQACSPQMVPA